VLFSPFCFPLGFRNGILSAAYGQKILRVFLRIEDTGMSRHSICIQVLRFVVPTKPKGLLFGE
jgi:hypothetical protein